MERNRDSILAVKPRLVGLDVLRFVAVVLVLGRHMMGAPEGLPDSLKSFLLIWKRGGWVGVDLFFVLSGFLVSGLLFRAYQSRGELGVARFYARRGWKIYPPFLVLITITVIVGLVRDHSVSWQPLAMELAFVQNYFQGLWNHTWSLAVEEHFYLVLPLALLAMLKLQRYSATPFKPVLFLAMGLCVLMPALRLANWHYHSAYAHRTHLFMTHLRLDSLFFGVVLSYLYHFHRTRFVELLTPWRHWLIFGSILLFVPAFAFRLETTPILFTAGLTQFYLASGMLLMGVLLCEAPTNRFAVALATLGAASYSIYLWHLPVIAWGLPLVEWACGPLEFGVRIVVYFVGSLAVGVVMATLVETPALRLRDRWFPRREETPTKVSCGVNVREAA